MNNIDPFVQFTLTFITKRFSFFDTRVFLEEDGLHTDLYIKKTNRNTILRYKSCNPKKIIIPSLLYIQMQGVKRIVDKQHRRDDTLDIMVHHFWE